MRFLVPILLIAVLMGAILFYPYLKQKNANPDSGTTAPVQAFYGEKVPTGFKGPTYPPHVDGPTSPPPNY